LEHIKAKHGGAEGYLSENGVSEREIAALRAKFLGKRI
jgi:hypothetical protein